MGQKIRCKWQMSDREGYYCIKSIADGRVFDCQFLPEEIEHCKDKDIEIEGDNN